MEEKNFVSYEYMTKSVKTKNQTKMMDMYEAFGWEVTDVSPSMVDHVVISFKRNRKQKHKQELTKLEREAESTFNVINNLEASKTRFPSIFAYSSGILSALVFGGGMCLSMLINGNTFALVGGILLGILGLTLCFINFIIFKKMVEKKTKEILPIIDDNEEKLANILEKGNDLLNTDFI